MALTTLAAAIGRQVLATGRVSQAATGAAVDAFAARLEWRLPAQADFRPLPARLSLPGGGWFAFHVDPRLIARPPGPGDIVLRLHAEAPGHQPAVRSRTVAAAAMQVVRTQENLAGHATETFRIAAAPFDLSVALEPNPVALAGLVLRDNDPDDPAAGATVEVTHPAAGPSTATDARGRFRIGALPVAPSIELTVTDGLRTAKSTHRIDFARPVNDVVLAVRLPD